jgi:hypothetical protein
MQRMDWLIKEWVILCVVIGLLGLALSVVIMTVRDVVNDCRSDRDHKGPSLSGWLWDVLS